MTLHAIKYNKLRVAILYYIVSMFMLVNGNLFSFIFKSIHLTFWRQIIFVIGIYFFYSFRSYFRYPPYIRLIKLYCLFSIIIVYFATFTVLKENYSIVRIVFTYWIYFSGLPFVILPKLFRQYISKGNLIRFYNIFIALGAFSTIGLCIDYVLGGAITQFFFLFNENLDDYSFDNIGRYYFLSESPTSFGLFYCFCLICVFFRIYNEKTTLKKMMFMVLGLFFIFGGWLTGSRQILLAQVIELGITGGFYLFHTKDNKTYLFYSLIAGLLLLPSITSNLIDSNAGLSERFTTSNLKEDKRSSVWLRGFEETCGELDVFLFGNAFGYTVLNNVKENESTGYHYENTFFARISETGIIGLILFLLPIILILKDMKKINFFKSLILGFTMSFLVVSFISPNGTHQTSQMVLFISLGLMYEQKYYSNVSPLIMQ